MSALRSGTRRRRSKGTPHDGSCRWYRPSQMREPGSPPKSPALKAGLLHGQAGEGIPAHDLEHSPHLPRDLVQDQAPGAYVVACLADFGQPDNGSQPSEIAKFHLRQVDVDFTRPVHEPIQRADQTRVIRLVDFPGYHDHRRAANAHDPQHAVVIDVATARHHGPAFRHAETRIARYTSLIGARAAAPPRSVIRPGSSDPGM